MNPKISLLVFTDGRGTCLVETLRSFGERVHGKIAARILIDDSGDEKYARWLDDTFPFFTIVHHSARRGFSGAIQSGWDQLPPCEYVFHLEDDFTFNRDVELADLVHLLRTHPDLAQVCLKRQAWSPMEREAGGFVEMYPDAYTDEEAGGLAWLENTRCFSTNPCLYAYALTRRGWSQERESEGKMTIQLREAGYKFALLGKRTDPPWVTHTGAQRVGMGY